MTASTASEHLKRLVEGALATVLPRGRHHYYTIASPEVAHAIETLMVVAPQPRDFRRTAIDSSLRRARTCYDHLAGELGVRLADALIARDAVVVSQSGARITERGAAVFAKLLGGSGAEKAQQLTCRPCLDWSERRFHLAGRAAAHIARAALERARVRRKEGTRAVTVTALGIAEFRSAVGLEWSE